MKITLTVYILLQTMAKVPPKYDDLGKECRDVFGKGYGKLQLNIKCKKSVKSVCDFT